MSVRRAPFLCTRHRRALWLVRLLLRGAILAESPLAFRLQLPLTLFQLLPKVIIFFEQRRNRLPLRVELPPKHRHQLVLLVGGLDETRQSQVEEIFENFQAIKLT